MVQTIEDFFTRQCQSFENNELGKIASNFMLPSAIYYGDNITVIEDYNSLERLLAKKRATLVKAGYKKSAFRIVAQSMVARKHLSAWVEFQHLDRFGAIVCASTSRYFCARSDAGEITLQLIEYLHTQTRSEMPVAPDLVAML